MHWTSRRNNFPWEIGLFTTHRIPTVVSRLSTRSTKPKRCSGLSSQPGITLRRSWGGDYKGSGVGPSPAYSFTTAVAEVSVDLETFDLTVKRITVAHDC